MHASPMNDSRLPTRWIRIGERSPGANRRDIADFTRQYAFAQKAVGTFKGATT